MIDQHIKYFWMYFISIIMALSDKLMQKRRRGVEHSSEHAEELVIFIFIEHGSFRCQNGKSMVYVFKFSQYNAETFFCC